MKDLIEQLTEAWAGTYSYNVAVDSFAYEHGISINQARIILEAGYKLRHCED